MAGLTLVAMNFVASGFFSCSAMKPAWSVGSFGRAGFGILKSLLMPSP
ncbi:MAG: hypothetical protein ABUS79_01400 [Pseudomonadota bacterium]